MSRGKEDHQLNHLVFECDYLVKKIEIVLKFRVQITLLGIKPQ